MAEQSAEIDAGRLVEALRIARAQLTYASSPTMGYVGPETPAEFARNSARDDLARLALVTCIEGARAALAKIDATLAGVPLWCNEHMEPFCPRHVTSPGLGDA